MSLRILSGTANPALAGDVATLLGAPLTGSSVERFPDGELRPAAEGVRGADVYVIQPTGPPVNDHLVELLLLLDACRRGGPARVTAVVPYLGYARQDRRGRAGQAIGAKVVTDAIAAAGADRLVLVDPHTTALEAMCPIPVETLTAVPLLAGSLAGTVPPEAVVVAPDLGAVKLSERYGRRLGLPVAVIRKTRLSGSDVRAEGVIGDVRGRPAVIVDDMISTGATIVAAVEALASAGSAPEVVVAVTHLLAVGDAADRLVSLPVRRYLVTDSLARAGPAPAGVEARPLAPLLADAVGRLHHDLPLDELIGAD